MGTPELFDEMGQLNKKDIQVIIADDNIDRKSTRLNFSHRT